MMIVLDVGFHLSQQGIHLSMSILMGSQTFCKLTDSNNNDNNNNIAYIKSIPILPNKSIWGTFHGWSQSLNLPPLPYLPTLGTNAKEVELTCVGLTAPVLNTMFWCRPRLRHSDMINWVDQILGFNGKLLCVRQTAILKGIIYSFAMVADKEGPFRLQVASMRMVDGELKLLSLLPAPIGSKRTCLGSFSFLLESCGLLYIVSVFYVPHGFSNVISVSKVWELDPPKKHWVEVKCLNGRAFFLGQHCSTWCWGSDNGSTISSSSSSVGYRKDCLYLPFEKLILYSYCLAERSITPFQTYQNLQPTGVSDYYWLNFKPQHHRLSAIQNRKEYSRKTQIHVVEEKVADEETEATESLLISILPTDMISLISEYIHLFEYRNFRASCKMFRSLVSPLPKRTNKLLPVPILIFFTTDDGQCRMIDPSRDDDSYYCNHLQLPEYRFLLT
ncbi:hypothetical protein RDABS01_032904 [Bienertia sinuspersici]